jgi:hypothetical protein
MQLSLKRAFVWDFVNKWLRKNTLFSEVFHRILNFLMHFLFALQEDLGGVLAKNSYLWRKGLFSIVKLIGLQGW